MLLTAACSGASGTSLPTAPASHPPVDAVGAHTNHGGRPPMPRSGTHGRTRPDLLAAPTERDVFVIRQGTCGLTQCSGRLLETTDGGKHWTQLPALPTLLGNGITSSGTVSGLLFANPRDGWLYGPALWATTDGGHHWRRVPGLGHVEQIAVSGHTVWALVGTCRTNHGCSSYRLMRSPVGARTFTTVALPRGLGHRGAEPDLAADAATVAVLNTLRPNAANDSTVVEQSRDDGTEWTILNGPCFRDLGGQLAVGGQTIWSVCPTGSLAIAYHSAGAKFVPLRPGDRDLFNGTQITGVDATGAIVSTIANRVYWTDDLGTRWHRAQIPNHSRSWLLTDARFPTRTTGYAIDSGPTRADLLRTDDGGRSWHPILN